MNKDRWPEAYLVGPPKTGTTTVHALIARHPGIFVPGIKELHYFSGLAPHHPGKIVHAGKITGDADYLEHFRPAGPDQVRVDVSPSYFSHPDAARRIHARRPDARILILLRDPVERAYSHYFMARSANVTDASFEEEVDRALAGEAAHVRRYIAPGMYHDNHQRFTALFPDTTHVLLTDDLKSDPQRFFTGLADLLGVAPFPVVRTERHNHHRERRGGLARWLHGSSFVRVLAGRLLPLAWRRWIDHRFLSRPAPKPALPTDAARRLWDVFGPQVDALEKELDRPLDVLRRTQEDA